jgi:hypothetical protein
VEFYAEKLKKNRTLVADDKKTKEETDQLVLLNN